MGLFSCASNLLTYDESDQNGLSDTHLENPINGDFRLTVYHHSMESDFDTAEKVPIYSSETCDVLAYASQGFKDDIQLQGAGTLTNGRGIHFVDLCRKVDQCKMKFEDDKALMNEYCYAESEPNAPYGLGSNSKPIIPYRTIAVDKEVIGKNQFLFIPQLKGLEVPGSDGLVHNGCVFSGDVGSQINQLDVDFFVPEKDNAELTSYKLRHFKDEETFKHTNPVINVYQNENACRNFGVDKGWIGDSCNEDKPCHDDFVCRYDIDENGGYCTIPNCEATCPDDYEGGYTFTRCISTIDTALIQPDLLSFCAIECNDDESGISPCRDGLECVDVQRNANPDKISSVCI